jgi:hypothetical protein
MTEARARLYLAAARNDPLVAAWIAILDEHQLPARAEIAPGDWQETFADLFWLDLISPDAFNAVDFKNRLSQLIPSSRAVDEALQRLFDLRAENEFLEVLMDKLDPFGPSSPTTDEKSLALRQAEPRQALATRAPTPPLASNAPAPFDLFAAPTRAAAPLASSAPSPLARRAPPASQLAANPLAATRRALEQPAALPCHRVGGTDEGLSPPDPRTFIKAYDLRLYCCGQEVELDFENGEQIGTSDGGDTVLVEFVFYAQCPHCKSDKHIHETRQLPAEAADQGE